MLFGLFHPPLMQATLAVVAGIVFFVARRSLYALATGAISSAWWSPCERARPA